MFEVPKYGRNNTWKDSRQQIENEENQMVECGNNNQQARRFKIKNFRLLESSTPSDNPLGSPEKGSLLDNQHWFTDLLFRCVNFGSVDRLFQDQWKNRLFFVTSFG